MRSGSHGLSARSTWISARKLPVEYTGSSSSRLYVAKNADYSGSSARQGRADAHRAYENRTDTPMVLVALAKTSIDTSLPHTFDDPLVRFVNGWRI